MKTKQKALLATTLALTLGTSVAFAGGLQLDPTGTGNVSGSIFLEDPPWGGGNVLADDLFELGDSSTDSGNIYAHASGILPGLGILTYQFILPVDSTSAGGGTTVNFTDRAGTSDFAIFFDPTPNVDSAAGTGYGDLNGGSLDAGQVELLSGTIEIDDAGTFIFTDLTALLSGTLQALSPNNSGVATITGNGSGKLSVVVDTQNESYVVNDMIDTGFAVDLSITTLGISLPFTGNSSAKVVEVTPDFGDAELISDGGSLDGQTLPVNDFLCEKSGIGTSSPCDMQYESSTAMTFNGAFVPEPVTLALTGLGMGLMGLAGRRRRLLPEDDKA